MADPLHATLCMVWHLCCNAGEEFIQAFATPEYLHGKSLLKAALQLHQSKHSHTVGTEHLVVDSLGMGSPPNPARLFCRQQSCVQLGMEMSIPKALRASSRAGRHHRPAQKAHLGQAPGQALYFCQTQSCGGAPASPARLL